MTKALKMCYICEVQLTDWTGIIHVTPQIATDKQRERLMRLQHYRTNYIRVKMSEEVKMNINIDL